MVASGNFGKLSRYPDAADFFELLRWHMETGTRASGEPDQWGEPWDEESLSEATCTLQRGNGAGVDAVTSWLRDKRRPYPRNYEAVVTVLFGSNPVYLSWKSDFQAAYKKLPTRRNRPSGEPLEPSNGQNSYAPPLSGDRFAGARIYSDPNVDLIGLNYSDIDALTVEEDWKFEAVRYGEGTQVVETLGSHLLWLDPREKINKDKGSFPQLTSYFPTDDDAFNNLTSRYEVFFPRLIRIGGSKKHDELVQIFACGDIPYLQDILHQQGSHFDARVFLGLGGIGAFVERDGSLRRRTHIELGGGLGGVAALVAIAYADRRAVRRSPYCLMIRKGIRYPDDVWLSPATGRPVFSAADPAKGRFLFQSRDSRCGSTDMFAANFDGKLQVNLNDDDEAAWDGFVDEDGNDLVSWSGNRITFGSRVTGKGFIERITREDLPPLP